MKADKTYSVKNKNKKSNLYHSIKFPGKTLGKKGFLFTIMTLILLMPILMIAIMHYESEEKEAAYSNKLVYAKRISYVMDDISYDIKSMNDYNIYFTYDSNKSQLNIRNLTFNDRTNLNDNISIFVTGVYSNITNQNLSVNLTSSILVYRNYSRLLTINISNSSINITGLVNVEAIEIIVKELQAGTLNTSAAPISGSGIPVRVRIEDYYDNPQLDQTRTLTVSAANTAFYALENSRYVNVSVANNSIMIKTNISLEIKSLTINLTTSDPMQAYTGNITINEHLGLKKQSMFRIG